MESISVFDIFKIGVGPSSSHTLGPWKAALEFRASVQDLCFDEIKIRLYGSLSKTGLGHATDKAVALGLMGFDPKTIDTDKIPQYLEELQTSQKLDLGSCTIDFEYLNDIVFENSDHDLHPNTLTFEVSRSSVSLMSETFASVGGGFIETANSVEEESKYNLPYPIVTGEDLIKYTNSQNASISEVVLKNELSIRSEEENNELTNELIDCFIDAVYKGCCTEGILPGGLNVSRRAKKICDRLLNNHSHSNREEWLNLIKSSKKDFSSINSWVSCFALAVNEQNAALGRIVTGPTNGAAGVIPAVMLYYYLLIDEGSEKDLKAFLHTAAEIGCLFKKKATISAAVGGCQAEIGVSSAMAAAGLTEVMGGTPEQCLMAAEIAMEHHLGLTCDPIGGLVQVPCIERNAMGAVKAITASQLALESDAEKAIVKLDSVIETMWEVAQNMNSMYKETSEGGLAQNVPVALADC